MPTPALRYSRYCEGCDATDPPVLIPWQRFKAQYFMAESELRKLLRRRVLVAKKFKRVNFIAVNPQIAAMGLTLEDFR
ncbi:MAG: hypothetical protein ACFB0C_24250 [Leptolyngbyaceae cyanobacterium]